MIPPPAPSPNPRLTRVFRNAFLVALALALIVGAIGIHLYLVLLAISPCDGGLGPSGPNCSTPPLVLAQLGFVHRSNGTYQASVVVSTSLWSEVDTTEIAVSAFNNTTSVPVVLSSVVVDSTQGAQLANYTATGTDWTTSRSVEIWSSVIFQITSETSLVGTVFWVGCENWGIPQNLT